MFRHGARTPLHLVESPATVGPSCWQPSETADVPDTVVPLVHLGERSRQVVDEDSYDLIYRPVKLPGGESIGMLTSQGQRDMKIKGEQLRKDYAASGMLQGVSNPLRLSEMR